MKKITVTVTIAGPVAAGKSLLAYFLGYTLRKYGFQVSVEGSPIATDGAELQRNAQWSRSRFESFVDSAEARDELAAVVIRTTNEEV